MEDQVLSIVLQDSSFEEPDQLFSGNKPLKALSSIKCDNRVATLPSLKDLVLSGGTDSSVESLPSSNDPNAILLPACPSVLSSSSNSTLNRDEEFVCLSSNQSLSLQTDLNKSFNALNSDARQSTLSLPPDYPLDLSVSVDRGENVSLNNGLSRESCCKVEEDEFCSSSSLQEEEEVGKYNNLEDDMITNVNQLGTYSEKCIIDETPQIKVSGLRNDVRILKENPGGERSLGFSCVLSEISYTLNTKEVLCKSSGISNFEDSLVMSESIVESLVSERLELEDLNDESMISVGGNIVCELGPNSTEISSTERDVREASGSGISDSGMNNDNIVEVSEVSNYTSRVTESFGVTSKSECSSLVAHASDESCARIDCERQRRLQAALRYQAVQERRIDEYCREIAELRETAMQDLCNKYGEKNNSVTHFKPPLQESDVDTKNWWEKLTQSTHDQILRECWNMRNDMMYFSKISKYYEKQHLELHNSSKKEREFLNKQLADSNMYNKELTRKIEILKQTCKRQEVEIERFNEKPEEDKTLKIIKNLSGEKSTLKKTVDRLTETLAKTKANLETERKNTLALKERISYQSVRAEEREKTNERTLDNLRSQMKTLRHMLVSCDNNDIQNDNLIIIMDKLNQIDRKLSLAEQPQSLCSSHSSERSNLIDSFFKTSNGGEKRVIDVPVSFSELTKKDFPHRYEEALQWLDNIIQSYIIERLSNYRNKADYDYHSIKHWEEEFFQKYMMFRNTLFELQAEKLICDNDYTTINKNIMINATFGNPTILLLSVALEWLGPEKDAAKVLLSMFKTFGPVWLSPAQRNSSFYIRMVEDLERGDIDESRKKMHEILRVSRDWVNGNICIIERQNEGLLDFFEILISEELLIEMILRENGMDWCNVISLESLIGNLEKLGVKRMNCIDLSIELNKCGLPLTAERCRRTLPIIVERKGVKINVIVSSLILKVKQLLISEKRNNMCLYEKIQDLYNFFSTVRVARDEAAKALREDAKIWYSKIVESVDPDTLPIDESLLTMSLCVSSSDGGKRVEEISRIQSSESINRKIDESSDKIERSNEIQRSNKIEKEVCVVKIDMIDNSSNTEENPLITRVLSDQTVQTTNIENFPLLRTHHETIALLFELWTSAEISFSKSKFYDINDPLELIAWKLVLYVVNEELEDNNNNNLNNMQCLHHLVNATTFTKPWQSPEAKLKKITQDIWIKSVRPYSPSLPLEDIKLTWAFLANSASSVSVSDLYNLAMLTNPSFLFFEFCALKMNFEIVRREKEGREIESTPRRVESRRSISAPKTTHRVVIQKKKNVDNRKSPHQVKKKGSSSSYYGGTSSEESEDLDSALIAIEHKNRRLARELKYWKRLTSQTQ